MKKSCKSQLHIINQWESKLEKHIFQKLIIFFNAIYFLDSEFKFYLANIQQYELFHSQNLSQFLLIVDDNLPKNQKLITLCHQIKWLNNLFLFNFS